MKNINKPSTSHHGEEIRENVSVARLEIQVSLADLLFQQNHSHSQTTTISIIQHAAKVPLWYSDTESFCLLV